MSIRARLAIGYGAAIVLTLALVGGLVWWQLGTALRAALDQTLQARAAGAITSVENNGQIGLQETNGAAPAGIFVALFDPGGHLLDATAGTPAGLPAPTIASGSGEVRVAGTSYAIRVIRGDNGSRAVAGSSLAPLQSTLDSVARLLLVFGGAAALISLIGGWWLAGRAMRPVAALTREAAQIGATDLDRRLTMPTQRDELRELAATLNGMLERVAESVRRQRAFVAAASHDLRTPIAALQAELELAEDPRTTADELRAAVATSRADAVRLGELAAALLDLAATEAGGRALVRSPVRADQLVESVVRRVEPLARERGVDLLPSAPIRLVRVDRVRLEQALTNLLVNAISYGPPGSGVEILARLEAAPDGRAPTVSEQLVIEVLDRGPGVAPELSARLFEPFNRGSDQDRPGTGLGLATAAAAVRAHHGSIGYEPRDGGGSRFWLHLPA